MKTSKVDYTQQIELYQKLLKTHGNNVKSVNWGSDESQGVRFQYLLRDFDSITGKTLLDVGCGRGDMLNFIRTENYNFLYRGLDITPEMINLSKERFPIDAFHIGDVFSVHQTYDYITASGIFYLVKDDPLQFMKKAIEHMWIHSRLGISFNSLSLWACNTEEGIFYANPQEILDYCKKFSSRINFYHSYHPRDFSLVILKN